MIFATESITYLFNMADNKNIESCKPTEYQEIILYYTVMQL